MCNRVDSVDLTRRTSSESVVDMRAGFVSALPGEECEHTGNHGSTVRRGAGRNDLSRLMRLKGKKKVKTMTGSQSQIYILSVCVCVCVWE